MPQNLTPEAKKEFLQAYSVKVAVAPGNYRFVCVADTILFSDDYDEDLEAFFSQKLRDLEEHHPEISLQDLMDYSKIIPDDNLIVSGLNKLKKQWKTSDLISDAQPGMDKSSVTIERTSACRLCCTYDYPSEEPTVSIIAGS